MNFLFVKKHFYHLLEFYMMNEPIQHLANFEFSINIEMEVNQQNLIENSPRRIFSVHFIG